MLNFIIRRSCYSILILLGVVLLTFLLFNVAAGDPAAAVLGKNARPDEVESLRRELGADLPLLYGRRCRTEAVPGYAKGEPLPPGATLREGVIELVPNFPEEKLLMAVTGADGKVEERPVRADAPLRFAQDSTVRVEFFRLQSNPFNSQFLRALGEIIRFQPEFPYVRVLDFGKTITTREPIGAILRRGVWPSLCLMIPIFLGELVIGLVLALVAAAKGVSPVKVYGKHLLRNAAIQIITRASAALPFLFTGSLLLESFFGIPGLGFTGIDALYNSDLQLLKALVVTSALLFVVMNLLADLAYAWADPRIRLE